MNETRTFLTQLFYAPISLSVLMAVLFETGLLPDGLAAGTDTSTEFAITSLMELVTICSIPVALRLFKFAAINRQLTTTAALRKWGGLRIAMLGIPMVVNTLLYYLYLGTAFGYMGIILLLCMFFVMPSKDRCESEIHEETDTEDKPTAH